MYYNSLTKNFSQDAEESLLSLAYKYELTTGKRLMWRKEPKALYKMVGESINSRNKVLQNEAIQFLKKLSAPQYLVFEHKGIKIPESKINDLTEKAPVMVQKILKKISL